MAYRVLAPLVVVTAPASPGAAITLGHNRGRQAFQVPRGALLPKGVDDWRIEHLLRAGLIEEAN